MAESIARPKETYSVIGGIEDFRTQAARLRKHERTYVVATFKDINPVAIKVLSSGGKDRSANIRDIPSKEELLSIFDECKGSIEGDKGYFIVYDFGYFTDEQLYRNLIVLISYLPENLSIREKMAYSSNMLSVSGAVDIAHHIPLHEMEEFTYANILNECMRIQRK